MRNSPLARSKRVLVFRPGQLGDALVSVPAIRCVRETFPTARITMLHDVQVGRRYVQALDVFEGTPWIDAFIAYPVGQARRRDALYDILNLYLRLSKERYDTLIYLAPSLRTAAQMRRDRKFFALCGIGTMIGMDRSSRVEADVLDPPASSMPVHEADRLLAWLKAGGLAIPHSDAVSMKLPVSADSIAAAETWMTTVGPKLHDKRKMAIGVGSKMLSKQWPLERYADVVARLIQEYDIFPIVVGGEEDAESGNRLVHRWGRGAVAAGRLAIPPSLALLQKCVAYLGNDTGAMHLSVAAGIPCIAVFSARDATGKWHPYGRDHAVLRASVPCEGCMLTDCVERGMECLLRLSVAEVHGACRRVLAKRLSGAVGSSVRIEG